MDPKHDAGRMLFAPGVSSSATGLSFPGGDHRAAPTPFPRVDDHLVEPEVSREEYIRGRKIVTMGANPPHAEAHARLDMVITPHVRAGYVAASDLLTRVTHASNFATDVSVRKEGIDPKTGARYLEELSFEIVNEQSLRDVTEKAEDLMQRGVRRVFAVFVKTGDIREWSRSKNEFVAMNKNATFDDPLFIRPIRVQALVDATLAEAEVVRALEVKGNPELARIHREGQQAGHKEGHKEGHQEGWRAALLELLRERFGEVPAAAEARVRCAGIEQVRAWTKAVLSAACMDDVFADVAGESA